MVPTFFRLRPSLSVIPASAPCLRRKNGMGSITRELYLRLTPIVPDGSDRTPHRLDLGFWYGGGFGSPLARAQGIGYVQELVARLTKTPIETVRRDPLPRSSSVLFTTAPLHSITQPLTRRWITIRSRSRWTGVPSTLTPLTILPS